MSTAKQRLQAWGNNYTIPIVSCLIFNEHQEILLLQRHAADLGGGKWCTPGGRIDSGETVDAAAVRELYEETGLHALPLTRLGVHLIHMPHGAVRMTSYLARVTGETPIALDPEEHQAFAWLPLTHLLKAPNIIWGLPTVLRDFGLFGGFVDDPTLSDGTTVTLLARLPRTVAEGDH